MKKPPSKAEIRAQIDAMVEQYIEQGGAVAEIPRGQSGLHEGFGRAIGQFSDRPKQTQTFVPEIIAAIDARRKPAAPESRRKPKKPQKRVVLDDFGEPIRWEWIE